MDRLLHSYSTAAANPTINNISRKSDKKFKFSSINIAYVLLLGLLSAELAYAQTTVSGPLTGNQNFSDDTTIILANTNNNTAGLTANSSETATANSGYTIIVDVQGEATTPTNSNNGLVANTGGTIDFSNNKVVITNSLANQPKLGIGILANAGTVKIGDDSEVYALKASAGIAVSANAGGTVNIGNNAILQGSSSGSAAILGNGTSSNITIGTGASIVNDGTGDTYGSHRGVYAMSGSTINIGSDSDIKTLTNTGTSSTNHGVQAGEASHSGTVVMGDNISISTQGNSSYGIFSYNTASSITAGKTSVTTTGNSSYGLAAAESGIIKLGASSIINTNGSSSHAINAQSNAQIELGNNSTITTSGVSTLGVSSHSGAIVTLGNHTTINTSGATSYGMQSDGTGSKINVGNNFIFESTNSSSRGLQTRRGGEITLGDDASITTQGSLSWGINSNGDTSYNSLITTGLRTTIVTSGSTAHGAGATNNGTLKLGDGASITVNGDNTLGVFSSSNGKTTVGNNATIIINGDDAQAVYATATGNVTIGNNSSITAAGAASQGLYAATSGQIVMGNNNIITTEVNGSDAIVSTGANTKITLGNSATVVTKGTANTYNIYAENGGVVALNGGATITNAATQTTNNYALYATGANSHINGSAAGVYHMMGDINANTNGTIDLNMASGSDWTGASYLDTTAKTNITLATSTWNMTEDSFLTSLNSQNSKVNFQSLLGSYQTLSTGSLSGNGTFAMNVDMASQQGDLLKVTANNVVGSHHLTIANVGSASTTGNEVLTVVETLDNTQGRFTSNTVEAGAYQYKLRQAANNTSWELYGAGARRTTTADASVNVFSTNYLLSYIDTQTLLQRMGQLRSSDNQQGDFWIRGFAGKLNSFGGNVVSGFDMNYRGTQAGIDKLIDTNAGRFYVGGMIGMTDADPDYHGGHGTTKDYHVGLYTTFITNNDLYVDGVIKYTHMKNRFNVKDSLGNTITGKGSSEGYSVSVETGKRFYFAANQNGYYIEPQAQLTYGYQGGMTINGSNGLKTKLNNYNHTLGRASTLVGYTIDGANPVDIYVKTGYVREFDGKTSYKFNQGNKINHSFKGGWWDNGIGVNAQIKDKHNIYLDLNYAKGSRFDQKQLNLGYRYSF